MIINRVWCMPNKNTFSIKPIKELIEKYISEVKNGNSKSIIIDPFANKSKLADITNDLDTQYDTTYHMEALDFLKMFDDESADMVLWDAPYSPRQIKECYKAVNFETTQASYWGNQKKEIGRIVKKGGYAPCFGWNSGGIGASNGFEIVEILLVPHGGNHNDTIVTVCRKV